MESRIFKKQAAHLGLRPLEEAVHILLLKAFDRFAADNDITYVLYGGTLIGAHRLVGSVGEGRQIFAKLTCLVGRVQSLLPASETAP